MDMFMTTTTSILSFGDTFALPVTGEEVWCIRDVRPVSYLPPENLTLPGRSEVARAYCASHMARYEVGTGWVIFGAESGHTVIAEQLNALDVRLGHRTDEEWRELHFEDIRRETEQALSTVVGPSTGPFPPHPLVTDEESIAFIAAVAAVTAAKRRDDVLFDAVRSTVLNHLNA